VFTGLNFVDICGYTGVTTSSVAQETRPFFTKSRCFYEEWYFFVTVVFIVLVFLYQNSVLDNTFPHDVLIHYSNPQWGLLVCISLLFYLFLRSGKSAVVTEGEYE